LNAQTATGAVVLEQFGVQFDLEGFMRTGGDALIATSNHTMLE
jgi:hypothetical protein